MTLPDRALLRRYIEWGATPEWRYLALGLAGALFVVAVYWSAGAVLLLLGAQAFVRMVHEQEAP